MRRAVMAGMFFLAFLASVQVSVAGKPEIVASLGKVQTAIEVGASKAEYMALLNDSSYEINVVGKGEKIDSRFLLTANACHLAFTMLLNAMDLPSEDSTESLTVQLLTLTQEKLEQLRGML